jgi:putative acetyltransferase
MINCIRTDSKNPDFQKLVKALDQDLRTRDGEEHSFYAQFNQIDLIKYVIVAYEAETSVGCGAIKADDAGTMEVKRMYVLPEKRGKGVAAAILKELENWAAALNYKKCVLETGRKQPEAIALYQKSNYQIIPSYGQYQNVENSVCFEKILKTDYKNSV